MKIINAIKSKNRKTTATKRATAPAPEITSEEIARRAYFIWEQQGRPAGKEAEHWYQAEQQLKSSHSFAE